MKKILTSILLGLLALAGGVLQAAPLGTAFTYQGRLEQNGFAAPNGIYQMNFALFVDAMGGNPLASNNVASVPVTNGLFNSTLDFGATAFTGEDRWLQITVRTNNNALPFTLLLPRTRLAPTPNAVYASTAGTVPAGAIQATQLGTLGASTAGQVLTYNGSSLLWQTPPSGLWQSGGSGISYSGNVGIGTLSPSYPLHVAGSARIHALEITQNLRVLGGILSTPGAEFIVEDRFSPLGDLPPRFIVKDNGRVGVGTSTPQVRLDVRGDTSISGNLSFGSQVRQMLNLWDTGFGIGVQNNNMYFRTGAGSTFAWHHGGSHANGHHDPGTDGSTLMTLDTFYLTVRGGGDEQCYVGGDGNGDVQVGSQNPAVSLVTLWNTGSGGLMNLLARDVSTRVLTITGGADLAEPFPMKEETIEKGSVVVIDKDSPGRLKRSTHAYDKRVAGIVSGANGIQPGISLKQEGALDQGENVALTGRVYVKADASFGEIEPGDLLTSSDTPGHAMKVSDHTKSQGAILGKAMGNLKEGTGLVLVLVTLQ